MSDLMKRETRGKLALGAGGIAGGLAVWTVGSLVAAWPVALIVGGLVVWGSWRLFQKPNSTLVGMVGLVAGAIIAATAVPFVGGLAKLLLGLSGLALVAGGIWSIVQVFRSRRS